MWPNQGTTICFYSCCTCCSASYHLFLSPSQHNLNDTSQASPENICSLALMSSLLLASLFLELRITANILYYISTTQVMMVTNVWAVTALLLIAVYPNSVVNWDERMRVDRKSWKSMRFIQKYAFVSFHICKTRSNTNYSKYIRTILQRNWALSLSQETYKCLLYSGYHLASGKFHHLLQCSYLAGNQCQALNF